MHKSLLRAQGCTLIFSHIRRLCLFFLVQNSEFQYFWGFQKNEYFLGGIKILWIFFWGSSQNWASLRVISMQFRVFFLRSRYKIGIFLGLLKIKMFFGVLKIPDIFWGWTVDAGSEPTYAEKIRVPPPPPPLGLRGSSLSGAEVTRNRLAGFPN